MRTSKDIDFTQVDFITYAVDEYLNDIPMYELVAYYIELFPLDEHFCQAVLDGERVISINTKTNECFLDGEKIDGEQFVLFYEGEGVDPVPIIKKITGVDLEDYISDVTYKDGTVEYLDVKDKNNLIGGWRKESKKWLKIRKHQ